MDAVMEDTAEGAWEVSSGVMIDVVLGIEVGSGSMAQVDRGLGIIKW